MAKIINNPGTPSTGGGGKRYIHYISFSADINPASLVVLEYVCDREEPFSTIQEFITAFLQEGFLDGQAYYPCTGYSYRQNDGIGRVNIFMAAKSNGEIIVWGHTENNGATIIGSRTVSPIDVSPFKDIVK